MASSALFCLLLFQLDPASLVPLYKKALAVREEQLGPRHPKVARSASDLGLYLLSLGDRKQAELALRRALEIDLTHYPEDHPVVAEDRENLASALPPSQEMATLLEQAGRCSDPRIAARALSKLGNLHEESGRPGVAVGIFQKALALEETAERLNDLALLLQPNAAEPLFRKALALRLRNEGPAHPETAIAMNNLGNALAAQRKLAEAEKLQRAALGVLEAALGKEHPRVAVSCGNLASILRAKGNSVEAKAFYRRAVAINEKAYGPTHSEVAGSLDELAAYLRELGEKVEADRLERRAAGIRATTRPAVR